MKYFRLKDGKKLVYSPNKLGPWFVVMEGGGLSPEQLEEKIPFLADGEDEHVRSFCAEIGYALNEQRIEEVRRRVF